ncbi:hypothetical protein C8Q80DRAFT_1265820 [Daedaleopsis nitida]|nr:hypothetical protein C8Q80DRAFT_1265820 [Daedaleopsis nitida]
MLARYFLLFLFAGISRTLHTSSTSNRTIDDEYGDISTGRKPRYHSPQSSNPWALGSTCGYCHIQLDPTQVQNGTWHDATCSLLDQLTLDTYTVTIQFTGIAVYVYGVLAPDTDTQTFLDFTLDGVSERSFEHDSTSSTEFTYNALVFSKTNLDNTEHTLQILLHPLLFINSLFLFDYVIYTIEDDTKTPQLQHQTP